MTVLDIARLFLFVREAGENKGLRVQAIQQWGDGQSGDSWCCYFATMVLDLWFQGRSPIPRLGRCEDVHIIAAKNGWLTTTPSPGDLYLRLDDKGVAHHIGFFVAMRNGEMTQISGNTSEDGKSSNGDRVAERDVPLKSNIVFVNYPRAGGLP